jgi:8-oxo-dGTP pyrophosphatase MutT (NUDIX family)
MAKKIYSHPVSSVRLIVENEHGHILILCRANTDIAHGAWTLPGGKIDYGETVEESALRELLEETGLICTRSEFLFYHEILPSTDGAMHCIDFYLKCTVDGQVCINDESSHFAWITMDDLACYNMAFFNDDGLRRYWQNSEPEKIS